MFRISTGDSNEIAKSKRRKARVAMAEMHAATSGAQPWEEEHYVSEINKARKSGRPNDYIQALEDKLKRCRDRKDKKEREKKREQLTESPSKKEKKSDVPE